MYNKPIPTLKLIYGIGLVVLGIISIIFGEYLGYMFIGTSLYFLKRDGIEFDLTNEKYRKTISLFGLYYGKWQVLPDIEYVSVFRSNQTTRVWVSTASTNVTDTIIEVNLFYDTNQKIEAFETQNINKAFLKAKELANALKVDILDATKRESNWL